MCCRQLIVAVAVGSVDVLQAASTSALKSLQNVNSMHVVVAERVTLITLSVHVCYRDDVQLQETDEQWIWQIGDECILSVRRMTADSAGTRPARTAVWPATSPAAPSARRKSPSSTEASGIAAAFVGY